MSSKYSELLTTIGVNISPKYVLKLSKTSHWTLVKSDCAVMLRHLLMLAVLVYPSDKYNADKCF